MTNSSDQNRTSDQVGRSIHARHTDRWPAELRADSVARLFDFETTGQLWKAIARGEAPRPTAFRIRNRRREPVWALEICYAFIARRHELKNNLFDAEDIRGLL